MPRGVRAREDLAFFRTEVPDVPLLVIAGADDISVQEYADLGYQIMIYATTPAVVAANALMETYRHLKDTGLLNINAQRVAELRRRVEELISLPEYYAVEAALLDLGMAAFVFDIGIAGLPAGADSAAYQTHAQLGAEIVRRWAPPRAGVVEAILQHHERENGRGYPQGLAGAAIHPNAKIIALMDTYTALIFPRPPGRRLPPHEAIREIVRSKHEDFATPLIKALLAEISVFPPRTVVKLNTGEVGRVIAVNRDHPLRPKVEVVADLKGNPLPTPKILDLSEAPFIYVTGPVQEEGRP
jgi:hypothetical protein